MNKFLTAEWRYLSMINYEVDPAILMPHLPKGVELDTWRGKTFVSVVGFLFLDTKIWGIGIPFHRNFEEVNLRFYVRRKAEDGWRRGVVFIKEIVPKIMIAFVARKFYGENYVSMPMRHEIDLEPNALGKNGEVVYSWLYQGKWNRLYIETVGEPYQPDAGSEEEFITEHYWGYCGQKDGSGLIEYKVEHPRWFVWRGKKSGLECDIRSLYGREFIEPLTSAPSSAFVALGSPVTVFSGHKIEGRR